MQQRILTFSQRFNVMDRYSFNLDTVTTKLNDEGWLLDKSFPLHFPIKSWEIMFPIQ